jgi:dihydroorotate dehydrogenase
MYKLIIRPLFFLLAPEQIHKLVFTYLGVFLRLPFFGTWIRATYQFENPKLEREVFGLKFKNPVGLAAGFDKDAKHIDELAQLGFGFIEIGTLTPKAQVGNPQPRLFRLTEDEAIINRMGFNNEGLEAAITHLKKRKSTILIGGNIGKNKVTPNQNAVDDYLKGFDALFDYVDYFVVNVSSPNTPNLRDLQEKEPLTKLLKTLNTQNKKRNNPKPILLKIAPDLTNTQLDDIVEIVQDADIQGVIATNTTISRANLKSTKSKVQAIGAGGLSGKPLKNRSTEVIAYLHQKSKGSFPIIGVGGIHSAKDALEKLEAGASLVQIYTGFIYQGAGLIKEINQDILKIIAQ